MYALLELLLRTEEFDPLSEEDLRQVTDNLASGGITGRLLNYVQSTEDKWKEIPLRIAIIGSSGSGKSSLINAIIHIEADDEGGAAVGIT